MTFEMVAVSLGEDSVAIPLTLVPLALVNVSIGVNHSSLALRHSVNPIPVVPITILEKERSSTMFLVLKPVSSILSPELAALAPPIGALSMLLIHGPHTLILVPLGVKLDAEALLAVVAPVPNVATGALPHLSFYGAVLLLGLLLNPVNGPVRPIFLCLGIRHLPVVDEWRPLLDDDRATAALAVVVLLLAVNTAFLLGRGENGG